VTLQVVGFLVLVVLYDIGQGWQESSGEIPGWILANVMGKQGSWSGGLAVLASWMTLALSGQWRAARGWVERFGRVIGVCWILTAFMVAIGDALIQADLAHQFAERFKSSRLNQQSPPMFGRAVSFRLELPLWSIFAHLDGEFGTVGRDRHVDELSTCLIFVDDERGVGVVLGRRGGIAMERVESLD
jgi:hypothetical protein